MDWIIRLTAAAVLSGLLAVLLEKTVPVNALLVTVSAALLIIMASVSFLEPILNLIRKLESVYDVSGVYSLPMIKCLLISLIAHFGAMVCKDAGQAALASSLETAGTIAAVWIVLPLLEAFLSMLEELI